MTISILDATQGMYNVTQEKCTICRRDYQEGETSDVTKVIELACHHFYHIGCISQSLMHQQNAQRKLTCSYCAQEVAPSAQPGSVIADQKIFQCRLQKIKEEYDYDNEVMEAIPIIDSLYTPLRDLFQPLLLESNDDIKNQKDPEEITINVFKFIIENESIRGDLKEIVMRVLSCVLTGDRSLRSIEGEASRWRRIPFENWPEKLKQKGVLVYYKYNNTEIPIRISANHLRKQADRFGLDFLLDHIYSRAPWILGGIAVAVLAKRVLGRL